MNIFFNIYPSIKLLKKLNKDICKTIIMDIHELIDNELSMVPYQSLSNRTKRYFKRNMLKLYNPQQEIIQYKYYNYTFYLFLKYYFIVTSVYFIFSFFDLCYKISYVLSF
jgi:hypothetical protein